MSLSALTVSHLFGEVGGPSADSFVSKNVTGTTRHDIVIA